MHITIRDIVQKAGGPTAVAAALGLRQSAVSNWIARGKASRGHAASLAALAGVQPESVRPDVEWVRDSHGAVIRYQVPVTVRPPVTGGNQEGA